jgi:pyrroline-5-carboxylate reductase
MDNIGKIVFVGAGRMASAIAGGLLSKGFAKENIQAVDKSKESSAIFEQTTGRSPFVCQKPEEAKDLFKDADIVVFAVKPQNVSELAVLSADIKDKLLISILAGVKIEKLKNISGSSKIARVMPNTPALVGEGVSAYSVSSAVSANESIKIETILGAVGKFCKVEEKLMDAVTGLSGSGPAYVFDFIQALADGGVNAGLPRDTALTLAAQTVLGAAKMVLENGEHPSVLRDRVTSPGGTTARGLAALEKGSFRGIVADAVIQAAARSAELGKD